MKTEAMTVVERSMQVPSIRQDPSRRIRRLRTMVDVVQRLSRRRYWLCTEGSRRNDYWERGDTNQDGSVDGVDFARLANHWKTSPVVEPVAGWKWIQTGFNCILMDIGFPEGQSRIGYTIGESLTYKGEGIVLKSVDGGNAWVRLTPAGLPGLEAMSFVDLQTGYVAGWDNYMARTNDGGTT